MSGLQWGDSLELGLVPMDATHREFVTLFNALAQARAEAMPAALDAFITHVVAHFDQENRWMEAVDFPTCHRAEHERVLNVLRDVRRRAERGDTFLVRRLIAELPGWFASHARGMDAALASHLVAIGFDFGSGRAPAGAARGGCGCAGPADAVT